MRIPLFIKNHRGSFNHSVYMRLKRQLSLSIFLGKNINRMNSVTETKVQTVGVTNVHPTNPCPRVYSQARRLFHMIVHPDNYSFFVDDTPGDRQVCGRILETLDQWTMRVALLDLRLLYRQTAKVGEEKHTQWLNTLARATIDAFQGGEGAAHRSHSR